MAGSEPVTSPDQHKPISLRKWRIAGVISIVALLLMNFGNHQGRIEDLWLFVVAGLIAAILVGDAVLRRNGLRR
jgi:hypothetical protein